MPHHLVVRPIGQSPDGESWTFGPRYTTSPAGSAPVVADDLQFAAEELAKLNSNKFLSDFFLSMLSAALWRQYVFPADSSCFQKNRSS